MPRFRLFMISAALLVFAPACSLDKSPTPGELGYEPSLLLKEIFFLETGEYWHRVHMQQSENP